MGAYPGYYGIIIIDLPECCHPVKTVEYSAPVYGYLLQVMMEHYRTRGSLHRQLQRCHVHIAIPLLDGMACTPSSSVGNTPRTWDHLGQESSVDVP